MSHGKLRMTIAVVGLRVLAVISLVLTGLFSAATSTTAQGSASVDIAIFTHENGQSAYDACYVLVGFSNVGCDENADGKVTFADVPYGTYTVQQTADLGPGRYVADFTINVTGNRNSAGFESHAANIVNTPGSSAPSAQTSNVAIVTTENGRSVTDACFVLVDYSNVGCDENADGKITFDDVPVGTYTVRQTESLGAGRQVRDFTINVTGASSSDGWERFPATVVSSGTSSSASRPSGAGGAKDISLITRDPKDGHLLTGTCYVLVGYSNEGCDENGDGQVTFAAMPPGAYTVRQTQTPAGFPTINDFPITVDDTFQNVPVGYIVKQARDQNTSGTRNVTFAFVDSRSYTKIVPAQICLKIGTVSNVGCDEDLIDGQIDFLDVVTGTHPLTFSNLPNGWQIMGGDRSGFAITVESGTGPQIIYIGVYTGNGSGTGGTTTTAGTGGGATSSTSYGGGLVMSCRPAAACAGGTITVTTEDGTFISSCTMTGDIHDSSHPYSCAADNVPRGVTVVLTIDGIAPGYAAEQNPVYFDTTNAGRASHDTGFSLVPTDGSTTSGTSSISGTSSPTSGPAKTWTASVQVSLCDAETKGGSAKNCGGGAGIVVNVALASGEFIGSCTTGTPQPTPWGFTLSHCTVDGMPFNSDFVATQDPSTIPVGYEPANTTSAFHIGNTNEGNGDGATFGFTNVRINAGASANGQRKFDEMVGEWYGKRRDVTLNVDGSGVIDYRQDAFGNGITYTIIVNPATSPVSATIADVTPYGDIDLAEYPTTGHTITLELQTFPDGDLLIVDMNQDVWQLVVCSKNDEDNVQNACY